jgi:hypothetical protein
LNLYRSCWEVFTYLSIFFKLCMIFWMMFLQDSKKINLKVLTRATHF